MLFKSYLLRQATRKKCLTTPIAVRPVTAKCRLPCGFAFRGIAPQPVWQPWEKESNLAYGSFSPHILRNFAGEKLPQVRGRWPDGEGTHRFALRPSVMIFPLFQSPQRHSLRSAGKRSWTDVSHLGQKRGNIGTPPDLKGNCPKSPCRR